MKLRTMIVVLIVLALVVGGGVAMLLGSVDRFQPQIQSELQTKLKRPVTIGKLSLKLLPLQIKIDGLTIGEAPPFSTARPFATTSTVFVSASLFSLIRGNPEVSTLSLEKPRIELIKNAQGVWNFASLGGGSSGGGDSQFSLGLLKIVDGQIGYTDETTKQARSVYDHIDLSLTDFAPNKQFGVALGVHFPGDGRQTLEFNGKVGPLNGAGSVPPVAGHVSVQQVSLAAVNRFAAGTMPANTDAVASGEADITSLAEALSSKGDLKLEDIVLNGAKVGYTISAKYDADDDAKQKKLQIRSGIVQLGSTTFLASGSVDTASTPARLNLQLKTDNSSVTELAKLAGALGVGFSPDYQVAGKLSMNVTAKGPANAPQLNGSVTAKGLEASGGQIKQPVSVPEIDLTLTPDTVMSNTFTAKSGATALAIAFTLGQYATKNPSIDASVKTNGTANIAELLNIAKAYGVAAGGATGEGALTLDVHVKGPLENASALTYVGTGTITNAKLTTPELTKPLTIASANAKFSENSVGLDNLAATLGGTNVHGSLSAKNFAAPQVAFALSADKIDTDEMQHVVAPTPAAPAKTTKGGPQKPGLLLLTTGGGTLAVGELKASDIVLKNVSAKCLLDKGVIQLTPLSANVFNGTASGSLTADMRPAVPQIAEKIKFTKVDANSLLSAVSSVKNTIYGTLAADTNLKFSLISSNDLARTLNGVISFNLADGIIKNMNIVDEVNRVGKILKTAGSDTSASSGGTAVKKLAGTMTIANGVASTNNLVGVLNAGTMAASGTLNLASQDVNMHLTATVSGLAVPVIVTGNMAKPNVVPDAAAMAKANLKNLIPGAAGQGVGGVLGGLLGGQQQSGSDAKQAQSPLGGLLNQFKKQKPKQ